jgi:hypothetical protein
MKSLDFGRYALGGFAAAAMLAACGGSQPPIGTPGAMPQSRAIATHAERGGSWMLPEAKSRDLLYASDSTDHVVRVYLYPNGQRVGVIKGFPSEPAGLCSDRVGNVYVTTLGYGTDSNFSYVYKYAHGGTKPIATLSDPGIAKGCAIDPATGNLAVSNLPVPYGSVAIYQAAQGEPTIYSDPSFGGFEYCTYDVAGNLYADGGPESAIDMLPKDASAFTKIKLSQNISSGSIQWWHNRLVIANVEADARGDEPIFNVIINGTNGVVRGSALLKSKNGARATGSVQFWTQDHTIIGPSHKGNGGNSTLGFWRYPKGGLATKVIISNHRGFAGVTVSLAQ